MNLPLSRVTSPPRRSLRTAMALLIVLPVLIAGENGAGNVRIIVDVCHATASDDNPYRFQTVDGSSIAEIEQELVRLGQGRDTPKWKSAGEWNGIRHEANDPKPDYISVRDGNFSKAWCLAKVAPTTPLTASASIAKYVATASSPAASCPGTGWSETTQVAVGEDVDWCVRVVNTGETELTGVTITDVLGADTTGLTASQCGDVAFSTLAVGSDPVICRYTTTAVAGPQTNTVTVDSAETAPVSDTAGYTTTSTDTASVSIAKYVATSASPAASCPGTGWSGTTEVAVGDDVDWCVAVENTGAVELTGVTITDVLGTDTTVLGANDCGGAFSQLTVDSDPVICRYTSTAITGPQTNTATVDTAQTAPVSDTAGYTTTSTGTFGVAIEKYVSTSRTRAASCPGDGWSDADQDALAVTTSETVYWCVSVTNTGTEQLTGIQLLDAIDEETPTPLHEVTACGGAISVLAAGSDPVICRYSTVAEADVHVNTVTVSTAQTADASAVAKYSATTPSPSVAVAKYASATAPVNACPGAGWSDADTIEVPVGAAVQWCVSISNDGNVPLTAVTVTDRLDATSTTLGATECGSAISELAVGADPVICRYSTVAKPALHTNTVTVDSAQTDPVSDVARYRGKAPVVNETIDGPDAPAPVVVPVVVQPAIAIEVSADSDAYNVGDLMTFTYVVTNAGDTPLSTLSLRDVFGSRTPALSTRSLQPGESTTVTVTTEALIEHVPAVTNTPVASGVATDRTRVEAQAATTVEVSEVLGFVIENPVLHAPEPAPTPAPAPDSPAPSVETTPAPVAAPVPAAQLPRTGTEPLPAAAVAAAMMILGAVMLRRPRSE